MRLIELSRLAEKAAKELKPEESLDQLFNELGITNVAVGILVGMRGFDWDYLELNGDLNYEVYRYSVGTRASVGRLPLRDACNRPLEYKRGKSAWTFESATFRDGQIMVTFSIQKADGEPTTQTLPVFELRRKLEI